MFTFRKKRTDSPTLATGAKTSGGAGGGPPSPSLPPGVVVMPIYPSVSPIVKSANRKTLERGGGASHAAGGATDPLQAAASGGAPNTNNVRKSRELMTSSTTTTTAASSVREGGAASSSSVSGGGGGEEKYKYRCPRCGVDFVKWSVCLNHLREFNHIEASALDKTLNADLRKVQEACALFFRQRLIPSAHFELSQLHSASSSSSSNAATSHGNNPHNNNNSNNSNGSPPTSGGVTTHHFPPVAVGGSANLMARGGPGRDRGDSTDSASSTERDSVNAEERAKRKEERRRKKLLRAQKAAAMIWKSAVPKRRPTIRSLPDTVSFRINSFLDVDSALSLFRAIANISQPDEKVESALYNRWSGGSNRTSLESTASDADGGLFGLGNVLGGISRPASADLARLQMHGGAGGSSVFSSGGGSGPESPRGAHLQDLASSLSSSSGSLHVGGVAQSPPTKSSHHWSWGR